MFYSPMFRIGCLLAALAGMGILAGFCFMQGSIFNGCLCISVIIVIAVMILRVQRKATRMFNRMLEDIRYHDFSLHYSYKGKSRTEQQMASQINQVIDNLKRIHLKYEEQSHYYKTLLDTIDSCIVVSDPSGKVVWTNRSAEVQICGHAFHSLDELGKVDERFPTLLRHMKPGDIKAIRIYKDDLAIDWAITLTEYLKKGIYYRLYHLRNIRTLLEENEMEAWQKLVRVLTHEIMNSIAPIISLSETLTDYIPQPTDGRVGEFEMSENVKKCMPSGSNNDMGNDEDEDVEINPTTIIQQGLNTIHRRSKGLLEFVENYRKLTRIGTPVLAPVKAKELLNDLSKLFTDIPLEIHDKHGDCILMIDRTQIEQVLINLIKNAHEACAQVLHPHIVIQTHYEEDLDIFLLSVSDNGKGILPEVQERIFVPFFTTKPTGSGIGLSICKQTMMLHGGTISVVSVPNKHTTFTLKFVNIRQ